MNAEQVYFIEKVSGHWFLRQLFSKPILEYIGCQFALESNFGQSDLATLFNNYSGMKKPFRRVHYGLLVTEEEFMHYLSFDQCIIDWCAWFFYTRPYQNVISDLQAFKIHLQNTGYCPEKDYINKINLIFQQFKFYKHGKKFE